MIGLSIQLSVSIYLRRCLSNRMVNFS